MQQVLINGKNIYTTFGAMLCNGAYEALLTPAPMKDYIENSSRNDTGVRMVANSSTSKTTKRQISFDIIISGSDVSDYLTRYESFISEITKGAFILSVTALKKTYELVYLECTKYGNYGLKKGKFTLKLVEPDISKRTSL